MAELGLESNVVDPGVNIPFWAVGVGGVGSSYYIAQAGLQFLLGEAILPSAEITGVRHGARLQSQHS